MKKYIIFNYYNYTVVETLTTDFETAKRRLNKLNNGYNQALILSTLKAYNSLIKGLNRKLDKIKHIVNES